MECEVWIVDCGLWIMDYGFWIMDHVLVRFWILHRQLHRIVAYPLELLEHRHVRTFENLEARARSILQPEYERKYCVLSA